MVQQVAPLDRPADNRQPVIVMEKEFDLRQYVAILIKYWYWIVGLAVVAAAIAFGVSSFSPSIYQATALVTATQPRYQLQFDPRFQNIPDWSIQTLLQNQYRTYPTLATSDEVLQRVADQTGWSLGSLRSAVQAAPGSDPSFLSLTVKGQNAEEVAKVANAWAEIFVTTANNLYGGEGDLAYFKQQQERVTQSLSEADTALAAFRKENGFGFNSSNSSNNSSSNAISSNFGLTGQRLEASKKLLTDYEIKLVQLHQLQREVELLLANTTEDTSPTIIAGLLSEMINTGIVEEKDQVFQVKLDSLEPVASLTAMDQALVAQVSAVEAETEPLRVKIADLQAELATKQEQFDQLIRRRDLLSETYATLSRKVQEVQLDVSNSGQVKIASQAAVPSSPASSRRTLNAAVAGTLGLMLSVFGVFVVEWWNGKN